MLQKNNQTDTSVGLLDGDIRDTINQLLDKKVDE